VQIERHLRKISARKVNPLAGWKYFSKDQRNLRAEVKRLTSDLSAAHVRLDRARDKLLQVQAGRSMAHGRLVSHTGFDVNDAEMRAKVLDREIRLVTSNLAGARAKLGQVERTIGPPVRELERLESERDRLNEDLEDAERFEEELSSVDSGRERAILHQTCQERFGTGRPKQVINDRWGRRALKTTSRRSSDESGAKIQKFERVIDHTLINGNSVCYEGQSFIGF